MRERGSFSTTTLAQPRRPRHPYAVPRTLCQHVCTRRRNCIGQLSPFSEYAPSASRLKLRGSGRVPLTAHQTITNEKFQMVLRRRHVVSTKFSRSLHCCCSCEHAGATVIRRWQDKQ